MESSYPNSEMLIFKILWDISSLKGRRRLWQHSYNLRLSCRAKLPFWSAVPDLWELCFGNKSQESRFLKKVHGPRGGRIWPVSIPPSCCSRTYVHILGEDREILRDDLLYVTHARQGLQEPQPSQQSKSNQSTSHAGNPCDICSKIVVPSARVTKVSLLCRPMRRLFCRDQGYLAHIEDVWPEWNTVCLEAEILIFLIHQALL